MTTAAISMTLQPASREMEDRLRTAREVLEQAAEQHQITGILEVVYKGQASLQRFGRMGNVTSTFKFATGPELKGPQRLAMPDPPLLTTALARLVQLRQIALESPLTTILAGVRVPDAIKGWRELTLRQLLERHSGATYEFPPSEPEQDGILSEHPPWIPQPVDGVERAEYVLESKILEALTGKRGKEAMESLVFGKRGTPAERAAAEMTGQTDWWWQGMELRARDLATVGQIWLNGGIYDHARLMTLQVERQFLVRKTTGDEAYSAGWRMAPAPGNLFSAETFGSDSWDGASLWVDPTNGLVIVIVFDPRAQVRDGGQRGAVLGPIRSRAHDAVFTALGLRPQK